MDDVEPVRPYVDPTLRASRKVRLLFFQKLARLGLVSYRRHAFSFVGIFFVDKKGEQIRMVLDARPTNLGHRLPPHTALGTLAAWAEVDLRPDDVGDMPAAWDDSVPGWWLASGDLEDSFYQFVSQDLGGDFCFDFAEPAGEYCCEQVWEKGTWTPVGKHELAMLLRHRHGLVLGALGCPPDRHCLRGQYLRDLRSAPHRRPQDFAEDS